MRVTWHIYRCCFFLFTRNSLESLLEAVFARVCAMINPCVLCKNELSTHKKIELFLSANRSNLCHVLCSKKIKHSKKIRDLSGLQLARICAMMNPCVLCNPCTQVPWRIYTCTKNAPRRIQIFTCFKSCGCYCTCVFRMCDMTHPYVCPCFI